MLASFDLTSNPFVHCPTYKSIAHLPLPERVEMLRKPEIRNAIVNEQPDDALLPLTTLARMFPIIYPLSDPPVYEPVPGTSVVDIATKQGRTPEEVAYDLLLEDDGKATLFVAAGNFAAPTLDYLFTFFDDPNSVMGSRRWGRALRSDLRFQLSNLRARALDPRSGRPEAAIGTGGAGADIGASRCHRLA